uniref:NADH-ubiquinone oxidoreductase chain 4L n=1 Tax=Carposina sasakii TaxID=252295 RepID=V9I0J1_CARSA|nr:NADH dehydrogenase subunit 4L [Carposina sasakii]ADZ47949.1 NADH dehydrogenase subunit 4L [Carposina sasakii]
MMLMKMGLSIFFMYLVGNFIFVLQYKHLLITLLSLEFLVLSLFFFFVEFFIYIDYDLYMLKVFLVFSVWEGALGLSILVSLIQTHGNDYFQSFNML